MYLEICSCTLKLSIIQASSKNFSDLHKNTIAKIHITTNANILPIKAGTGISIPNLLQYTVCKITIGPKPSGIYRKWARFCIRYQFSY